MLMDWNGLETARSFLCNSSNHTLYYHHSNMLVSKSPFYDGFGILTIEFQHGVISVKFYI